MALWPRQSTAQDGSLSPASPTMLQGTVGFVPPSFPWASWPRNALGRACHEVVWGHRSPWSNTEALQSQVLRKTQPLLRAQPSGALSHTCQALVGPFYPHTMADGPGSALLSSQEACGECFFLHAFRQTLSYVRRSRAGAEPPEPGSGQRSSL